MKKIGVLLMVLVLFLSTACTDDSIDDMAMIYTETKCDNPWDALFSQENYFVEVRSYLTDYGIQVVSVGAEIYDENAGADCNECSCPTGRNVVLLLPVRDAKKAEELGFVPK